MRDVYIYVYKWDVHLFFSMKTVSDFVGNGADMRRFKVHLTGFKTTLLSAISNPNFIQCKNVVFSSIVHIQA